MTRLLHHFSRDQAQRRPEAPALIMGETTLSYGELDQVSNGIAAGLRVAGCRPGDRVALLMSKSPLAVAGIVGALKAGCIYVPVDPGNPASRLDGLLSRTEPAAILVDRVGQKPLALMAEYRSRRLGALGWLDPGAAPPDLPTPAFRAVDLAGLAGRAISCDLGPGDPAYILFTSGSTGEPKGVTISHANVLGFLDWALPYFSLGPTDRLSGHPPLHFDLSMFDIFGAQAAGARLYLVPPELNLVPHRLADFIRRTELTQWFSVPSILALMARFDAFRQDDFPVLRRLLWCGEVFPTPALIHWMQRLPHVSFTNLYGPTETTIASSYYTLSEIPWDPTAEVPIGEACEGEELLVLNAALGPVPEGEPGELYIAGSGLGAGYWQDPERTGAAFVRHPATGERLYRTGDLARRDRDGLVYFLGRVDSQIKSRGYRIELGEIEAALSTLDYLSECAVVAVDSAGFEGKLVCCAYVPRNGGAPPSRLRKDLRARLPGYMIPARWLVVDRLPRNANGKIDRSGLLDRFRTGEPARG